MDELSGDLFTTNFIASRLSDGSYKIRSAQSVATQPQRNSLLRQFYERDHFNAADAIEARAILSDLQRDYGQ